MYMPPRVVFLSLILIISVFVITSVTESNAQEQPIIAKSVGFEETTIIEFENKDDTAKIDTIRIWLGNDFAFKSFKTEKGWIGQKTPDGLIVFTTSKPLEPGQVVKFGVKTDKPKPGINWKALEDSLKEIGVGKTLVSDSTVTQPKSVKPAEGEGVLANSVFRLIPEKPSVGSSIRVTGDNFGANQKLDFYIGDKKIDSFETDSNGHFIFTSSVPADQSAERVDFRISLRIADNGSAGSSSQNVALKINPTPPVMYRGDTVKVTGTGQPGSTVTATVKDESGNILTTIAVEVDSSGNWEFERIVPPDATLGQRTAEITDGFQTLVRTYSIESSKKIEITPTKSVFDPGETVLINGTAKPNQQLEIVVEDPQGIEFYSEFIDVDASGQVNISFPTQVSSTEGTYVLFAVQGEDTEITLIGIGEVPEEKIIIKPDKFNYSQGSKAILDIQGPASATLSLLIIDPSDKNKFSDTITLGPDGRSKYEFSLTGYGTGVYTVVLTRGNSQSQEVFAVGLQTGSGPIEVRTTKDDYYRGEAVLILGTSGKNILLTLSLIDPSENVVKTKNTYTNKDGVFSHSSFKIPTDAVYGKWKVHAKSGSNFDIAEFIVKASIDEGLVVFVNDIKSLPSGKLVEIQGHGALVSQNVVITIFNDDGEELDTLTARTTGVGEFIVPWGVPSGTPPGTYTIKAKDPVTEAETTFVLK